MDNKKKLIVISSIIAIGLPLLAVTTQTILRKARDDYYKTQKEQIESERARERAEREEQLAREKAEREQRLLEEKAERERQAAEARAEKSQKNEAQKAQKSREAKPKVKITEAAPVYDTAIPVKRELTKKEIRQAKKALKEARASYFSGNKAAKPVKTPKNTDKITIKTDSKGNVEAVRHTKEQEEKIQKILKEMRESYYKDSKNKGKK